MLFGCAFIVSINRSIILIIILLDLLLVSGSDSWREMSDGGSWFIQALCDQLVKCGANKCDFNAIITRASRQLQRDILSSSPRPEMDAKLQIPFVVSTLTRELFLVNSKDCVTV